MRGGRLAGILSRSQVSQEAIMRLAAGQEAHA
jgi:hypothetical protein